MAQNTAIDHNIPTPRAATTGSPSASYASAEDHDQDRLLYACQGNAEALQHTVAHIRAGDLQREAMDQRLFARRSMLGGGRY